MVQMRHWLELMVSGAGLARKPTHGDPQICVQQCRGKDHVWEGFRSLVASSTGEGGFCNGYNVVANRL